MSEDINRYPKFQLVEAVQSSKHHPSAGGRFDPDGCFPVTLEGRHPAVEIPCA